MSATRKPAPPRPKPQLGKAAFGALLSAAGADTTGDPMRVLLADIDEDPNQPRKRFTEAELDELAESIRLVGVVQPIVVRPPEDGRYTLVAGARRFRASKRAGVKDIPAVVRSEAEDNFTAQVVENTQRTDLDNSELAEAVLRFTKEGKTSKQIAAICNLKDWQITAFRKSVEFPPELRDRLDRADMRALYDLYRLWGRGGGRIRAALAALDEADPDARLTITEARRIAGEVTGKATGSIVLDREATQTALNDADVDDEADTAIAGEAQEPRPTAQATEREERGPRPATARGEQASRPTRPTPAPATAARPQSDAAPIFIVKLADGTEGRLVVDRRAERDGRALVEVEGSAEEFRINELTILRIE